MMLTPPKLTCPPKDDVSKTIFLLKWSLFRRLSFNFGQGSWFFEPHQILILIVWTPGRARCSECGGLCRSLPAVLKGLVSGVVLLPTSFSGSMGCHFLKKLGVHPDLTWPDLMIMWYHFNCRKGVGVWGIKMITWHHMREFYWWCSDVQLSFGLNPNCFVRSIIQNLIIFWISKNIAVMKRTHKQLNFNTK